VHFDFEWDPVKAKQNSVKHAVNFERAGTVFLDPLQITIFDKNHSGTEDRWITIGKDRAGIPLVVSHTFQQISESSVRIRIISARKATKNERNQYEEGES
jgi:uncharacterized protein